MSLIDTLGYRRPTPSALQRLVQRAAATTPGAWLLARVLHRLDRVALAVSRDGWSITTALSGLPIIVLTTTAARSGRAREVPLMAVPLDGGLAVLGTNFGQHDEPAWTRDLAANPQAAVAYGGRRVGVVAREVTPPAERAAILDRATAMYAGMARYAGRLGHRSVRVFLLEAAPR